MGTCCSKNGCASSSPGAPAAVSGSSTAAPNECNENTQVANELEKKKPPMQDPEDEKHQEESVKKEIFVIKCRKSHDGGVRRSTDESAEMGVNGNNNVAVKSTAVGVELNNSTVTDIATQPVAVVRTSSCTKEEVDAILIQCGRLSRCSSGKVSGSGGRKYSGSKRSFDFDNGDDVDAKKQGNSTNSAEENDDCGDDADGDESAEKVRYRRQREIRRSSRASSQGRRRTPSREREQQQQRSGSRERGSGSSGGGRRVSRSPGRRENPPISTTSATAAADKSSQASAGNGNSGIASSRPGKMVSVPASVTSLTMEKISDGGVEGSNGATVRRVLVRRNCGEAGVGSRTAASPRSQSPANPNANANGPSLSRNNSRKAEQSPYRRNPLSEIDMNSFAFQQVSQQPPSAKTATATNKLNNRSKNVDGEAPPMATQKPNPEMNNGNVQLTNNKSSSYRENNGVVMSRRANEQQQQHVEVSTTEQAFENLKLRSSMRSRTARQSRDLDFNPETPLNPTTASYTTLLLEDIQNFHQKNTTTATAIAATFSLPPCLSKAQLILEAVADLNSCNASNLPSVTELSSKNDNFSLGDNVGGKTKMLETPFMESEVVVNDDIMEPSFQRYVTVRRGSVVLGEDADEQESAGSNSFAGHWSSSIGEPNSADSTDRWTSSRSDNILGGPSPVGFQRLDASASSCDTGSGGRRPSRKKREFDHQPTRLGTTSTL